MSRWRWVLPEDASMGLTPHRAAKDASLWSRSGLSPAAMSSAAALSGPMPRRVSNVGQCRVIVSVIRWTRSSICSVSCRMRRASKCKV